MLARHPGPWSGLMAFLLAALIAPAASAQPAGYYDSAAGLTGAALHTALHNIIDNHTPISFSATRDAIDDLQQDPSNSSNVIVIYSGFSMPKSSWPDYNREHLWPISLGATEGTVAHRDVFNIYGCDADVNSSRGNKYFDECTVGCSTHPEAPGCLFDADSWEPRDVEKGDLARALFYMDVRYEGDFGNEPDLNLQDVATSIGCDCMGLLSVLIEWHTNDPPDAAEMARNNAIFNDYQGNRNPFVDHPEFVFDIWGGGPPPTGGEAWINEIHYDNTGSDTGEGVEIAGTAGTSLLGWDLVAYNGSNGTVYDSISLGGTIPDEQSGFGALWFPLAGLQNGDPDGIVLVDNEGDVVEFLSYEGSFVANDGVAAGMLSEDIGVTESGGTPVGSSLQLVGNGTSGPEFNWTGPTTDSPGLLNVGQTFSMGGPSFVRGDCNSDGPVTLPDALVLLAFMFQNGNVNCVDACDINDDGVIQLTDPLQLLGFLFQSGTAPAAPYPGCGSDPNVEVPELGCATYPPCP